MQIWTQADNFYTSLLGQYCFIISALKYSLLWAQYPVYYSCSHPMSTICSLTSTSRHVQLTVRWKYSCHFYVVMAALEILGNCKTIRSIWSFICPTNVRIFSCFYDIHSFSCVYRVGNTHSRARNYSSWSGGSLGSFCSASTHCCNQGVLCKSRSGGHGSFVLCAWLLSCFFHPSSNAFATGASKWCCTFNGTFNDYFSNTFPIPRFCCK